MAKKSESKKSFIRVSQSTWRKLTMLKEKQSETYDDVINKLIDRWYEK